MSTDTTLTSRQELMLSLCGDLNAQGWEQKHKLWYLTAAGDGEEWLTFSREFSGSPERVLKDLRSRGDAPGDVRGVLVASEGWEYPQRLREAFKTADQYAAYARTIPPDEHPEKVEIRHLLLACTDGEVLGLTYSHVEGADIRWARIDSSTSCPTGDKTVDAARAAIGLGGRKPPTAQGSKQQALEVLGGITSAIERAVTGDLSEEETTRELFFAMPPEIRQQMVVGMPEDVKNTLRQVLTPEERREYGL